MNRIDLKQALESILETQGTYIADKDDLSNARDSVDGSTSPDEAFDLATECYKEVNHSTNLDDLVDWITDNFEVKK